MNSFKKNDKFPSQLLTLNGGLLTSSTTKLFVALVCLLHYLPSDVNSARPPTPLIINKCCRIGEQLDKSRQCTIGGVEQWWPLIYLIQKQTHYEPHGEAPRFMKVRERAPPICDQAELITRNIALFSNGTLFLLERNARIESDNYCIDKDAALVCFPRPQGNDLLRKPIKQAKVRKCCLQKSIYEANTCTSLDNGHEILSRQLVQNSTNIEFLYGFPQCNNGSNNIAIVGKFNESTLDADTGNLTLTERTFQSDEYCLEHFNDTDAVDVHVFTCSEYLPSPPEQSRVSLDDHYAMHSKCGANSVFIY